MEKSQTLNGSADLIVEKVEQSLSFNQDLIKQIPRSYRGRLDPNAEAKLAEATIYPVWREFLRLYKAKQGVLSIESDTKVKETFNDFGDIEQEFQTWWFETGRSLFSERGQIPVITVEEIDEQWAPDETPKYITLRLPLTIPKAAIIAQLNEILKRCHLGSRLHRHQFSTAKYKLHPRQKYIRRNFERMLRVWELAMEYRNGKPEADQMPWWEVGHLARLAPGLDPQSDKGGRRKETTRRHLAKLASDLFEQSEAVMHNAVRGVFGKDKID